MDFTKDTEGTFSQQGGSTWNQRGGGRGGARGGFGNFNHSQNYGQTQNYNQSSYQSSQPQQWAPPAGAPSQNQPPPSWAPAPPQQQQHHHQQGPPQQAQPSGPPKIFVRADGCDAFLDLRVILPSDRFPNINWGGRVIGSKGATIKMLQNEHNVKVLINTDGNNGKDPTYDPNNDPPHVRVQASGPLGDVLRRMAAVADEFSTRFDPYWKDPLLDQQRKEQKSAENAENKNESSAWNDENKDEPSANGETDFTVDTPPVKDENSESKPPSGRGGFHNRGGRGRGGRGFNRGGRGGFRGRGGMRGGYNQAGGNFQQGGPMRNQNFQQSHNPY